MLYFSYFLKVLICDLSIFILYFYVNISLIYFKFLKSGILYVPDSSMSTYSLIKIMKKDIL